MKRYPLVSSLILSFSFILISTFFLILLYVKSALLYLVTTLSVWKFSKTWLLSITTLGFAFFLFSLVYFIYCIFQMNSTKEQVLRSDLGSVHVNKNAIVGIAYSAARRATSALKSAKIQVRSSKDSKLFLVLNCIMAAECELPQVMQRVQNEVKKAVENYTGLEVQEVNVIVKKIDTDRTRVDA